MKKIIVLCFSFIVFLFVLFCILKSAEPIYIKNCYYPKSFVVDELDFQKDIVYIKDSLGFIYFFYGTEDWQTGDNCAAIMFNNHTENIFDDKIIDVKYCG